MRTGDLTGSTVAVAGGSSGVGLAAAKGLARLGARTVVIARSRARGEAAVSAIRQDSGNPSVDCVVGGLESSAGARSIAEELATRFERLDVLVSTIGSVGEQGLTARGVPRSFDTNYLTHFRILQATTPLLARSSDPRALIVGAAPLIVRRLRSVRLDGVDADAAPSALLLQSLAWKLLLARFASSGSPAGPGVTVFHPGLIRSDLLADRSAPLRLIGSIANRFARTRCAVTDHLASDPDLAGIGGRMVGDRGRPVRLPSLVTEEHARQVWERSIELA